MRSALRTMANRYLSALTRFILFPRIRYASRSDERCCCRSLQRMMSTFVIQAHRPDTIRTRPMLSEGRLPNHPSLVLVGRLLFAFLFVLSGVTHFTHIPYYVSLIPNVISFPAFWTCFSGAVELIGALLIAFACRPRLGA